MTLIQKDKFMQKHLLIAAATALALAGCGKEEPKKAPEPPKQEVKKEEPKKEEAKAPEAPKAEEKKDEAKKEEVKK
jgi:nitrous oxide reductase accessory protein NosL